MSGADPPVVLLVEDDPDHAELVRRAVAELAPGISIVHLDDGGSALEYLARTGREPGLARPALVLLDLRLPGMDGVEVLRRLRESPPTHELPVVLLTTAELGDEAPKGSDPATARAVKPADGRAFRRLIADLVRPLIP